MFAEEIDLDVESIAKEGADVLVPALPESGDDTAEEAPVIARDEIEEKEKQAKQLVEEAAPEAQASETQAEETAKKIETEETAKKTETEETAKKTETEETAKKIKTEETAKKIETEETAKKIETEVSEPQDNRAWYVIHCYSGYENKVKHNLEQRIETMQVQDQIFQVVVPTEDEIEIRDGKRRTVERQVFPGYILVQMILTEVSWHTVRNTPGVTGFVGMGNEPTSLRPEEVQAIMKRMEAEAPKIKVTFKQGQKVRIIDGPFNEFIGVVDEIDMERAKVRVMVSFFGRDTPVELDFLQVEKA